MSHIDSYDHEYIGRLAYLPVYHPLQEVERNRWGEEDFGFTPANLILGGGSGEHPGLVIHKLECCVARFLVEAISDRDLDKLSQEDQNFLNDLANESYHKILEFCGWYVHHYAEFHEAIYSKAVFGPEEDERVEDWLIGNIGELVYYALPELNPEQERMQQMVTNFDFYPRYQNINCPPPGYPPSGGRKIIDGQLKWGCHRFYDKQE